MTKDIRKMLDESIPYNAVKERKAPSGGKMLSYVEGWWVIGEANRIFGPDGWHRETTVLESEISEGKDRSGKPRWEAYTVCRSTVHVRFHTEEGPHWVRRDGIGAGSGFGRQKYEAIESAMKEAETDAMKRALMTFGWRLGLALYDAEKTRVTDGSEELSEQLATLSKEANTLVEKATSPQQLRDFLARKEGSETVAAILRKHDPSLYQQLIERGVALKGESV